MTEGRVAQVPTYRATQWLTLVTATEAAFALCSEESMALCSVATVTF